MLRVTFDVNPFKKQISTGQDLSMKVNFYLGLEEKSNNNFNSNFFICYEIINIYLFIFIYFISTIKRYDADVGDSNKIFKTLCFSSCGFSEDKL